MKVLKKNFGKLPRAFLSVISAEMDLLQRFTSTMELFYKILTAKNRWIISQKSPIVMVSLWSVRFCKTACISLKLTYFHQDHQSEKFALSIPYTLIWIMWFPATTCALVHSWILCPIRIYDRVHNTEHLLFSHLHPILNGVFVDAKWLLTEV